MNNEEYYQACHDGDMEKVKAGTKELNIFKDLFNYTFRNAINAACQGKQLDVIKYLFNEIPEENKTHYVYKCHFDDYGNSILETCKNGSIEILDFFRNRSGFLGNVNNFEKCAREAYQNGQLDVIKHLLSLPDGKDYIIYKKYYNSIFSTDYTEGNTVAKYFLSNQNLSKDIKTLRLLERAYESDNVELVEYMIFDLDMQYSKKVKKTVEHFKSEVLDVPYLFANREKFKLAKELNSELNDNKINSKRIKI
jgi:hypothetical protein